MSGVFLDNERGEFPSQPYIASKPEMRSLHPKASSMSSPSFVREEPMLGSIPKYQMKIGSPLDIVEPRIVVEQKRWTSGSTVEQAGLWSPIKGQIYTSKAQINIVDGFNRLFLRLSPHKAQRRSKH